MSLSSSMVTRLEKAASDNGFDLDLAPDGDWLSFGSSHTPLQIWLTAPGEALLLVAVSQPNVWRSLVEQGAPFTNPLPVGASGARGVNDFTSLHHLLRRAMQLSRSLPDAPLIVFEGRVAGMPRATEAERFVVQRVGQDVFRQGLLDYWEGRCAISGLAVPELLRASHIKPWAACDLDSERLDVFNGFLLAPNLDAAFDAGFITVADDGNVIVAEELRPEALALMGLDGALRVRGITEAHRRYLGWHRGWVWRGR